MNWQPRSENLQDLSKNRVLFDLNVTEAVESQIGFIQWKTLQSKVCT